MNVATKIKELTQYPHEEEWFEFKKTGYWEILTKE